MLVLTKN